MELQHRQSKAVAVTCFSFLAGDVNNFVVGSEDCTVYTASRHGRLILKDFFFFFPIGFYFIVVISFLQWCLPPPFFLLFHIHFLFIFLLLLSLLAGAVEYHREACRGWQTCKIWWKGPRPLGGRLLEAN